MANFYFLSPDAITWRGKYLQSFYISPLSKNLGKNEKNSKKLNKSEKIFKKNISNGFWKKSGNVLKNLQEKKNFLNVEKF